jgi:polysaccharide export outer membrane protein
LRGLRRLTDVLALAGGTTPEAGEITVTRAGKVSQVSEREQDLVIQAHDEVRVAPAGMVYVVGEVGRPGGFPLRHRETVTLLKAVALAEGWRRTAAPQRARVIRSAGGARSEIPVRLADVLAGRAPDLALQPGDVLFVPHSQAKGAMARAAEAAVQVATGVVIWRR